MKPIVLIAATLGLMLVIHSGQALADDAAEMAKKLQDPLANIKALMTDNDINFKSGTDEDPSYGIQLQPVLAVPFEDAGFNLINRAVIPIMGLADGAPKPPLVPVPQGSGSSTKWGVSDTTLQFFFSPKSDSSFKWGLGPMFSLKTRTSDDLAGPGWGAGPVAVLVGGSGSVSGALIAGHMWGDENAFSTSIINPQVFYNLPNAWTINYANTISYNWKADSSSDRWTIPLGMGASKTWALSGGHGVEFLLGLYYNVERPEGAAKYQLKWQVNWLMP